MVGDRMWVLTCCLDRDGDNCTYEVGLRGLLCVTGAKRVGSSSRRGWVRIVGRERWEGDVEMEMEPLLDM